jgi:hypothetical protein
MSLGLIFRHAGKARRPDLTFTWRERRWQVEGSNPTTISAVWFDCAFVYIELAVSSVNLTVLDAEIWQYYTDRATEYLGAD